eukprot:CAMPEP_0202880210 /NCGR_PEP_ID=MMETSP1391-20130828/34783_1 /ASSEMBLY_ACC=CAM_ASM_000867 /TAXON_ID=1034604 /ORGANISM="Chlamydomonas leiostraca, Strain SAG 11-49" /LENGTH=346 /DNA_ID=CAMNT_0049562681 /DNA_START=65 /DNA_END=1105 /DNA_ORIENTATION=-
MTIGEQTSREEGLRQLSYAADAGVNFIDTAEIYPVAPRPETHGATSSCVGQWLSKQRRDQFVVATKVAGRSAGQEWVAAGRTDPPGAPSPPRVDAASIQAAAEGELRRLRTDYIDLLQIHWPDRYVPTFGSTAYSPEAAASHFGGPPSRFEEQAEAMGKLIQQGKIRAWGLSNETAFGVMEHCRAADTVGVPRPVTVQNCYNLIHRTADSDMAEVLHETGLGLLPWSALAGGSVTGKYLTSKAAPKGSRFDLFAARYARFNTPRVQAAVAEYVAIAKEAGLTPAQLGYAFCRSRWFIPSVIVGARTVDQLAENLQTWSKPAGALSQQVLDAIQAVHLVKRNPACVD